LIKSGFVPDQRIDKTFTSQINSLQNINCWTLDSGNLIYNIYHENDLLISVVRSRRYNGLQTTKMSLA
jgi:hypothetical protein